MSTQLQTFDDVQKACVVSEDWNTYTIENWLAIAKKLYAKAQLLEDAGELVEAYIFYSRTYEISYNGEYCLPCIL